jgi:gas vesicle protein
MRIRWVPFGTGIVCGAAAGLVLAPRPGAETRALIAGRLDSQIEKGRHAVERGREAREVARDARELVRRARALGRPL